MSAPTLLIGTTKGVFLAAGDAARQDWDISGPHCDGWTINHVAGDADSGQIWAAGGSDWSGAGVWRSEDGGANWTLSKLANGEWDSWIGDNPQQAAEWGLEPAPTAPFSGEIKALWSVTAAHGAVYAGANPAALLRSRDGGLSWEKLQGLTDHPTAGAWQPGAAGLTLHSIVPHPADPDRLWVGISAAGVFASEDGGATWHSRIRRSNAEGAAAPPQVEGDANTIGGCVHNMVLAPGGAGDERLYQQNHHGVFRSGDGGRSWDEITRGLPSDFGFPVAVHPVDPDTLWVFPLNGDSQGRFPPEASAAVWKSTDGGDSWRACADGLPGRHCFFTVLRQAMATDRQTPCGVYFGTNSGSIFASRDEGETWDEILRHLPTVLSVEVMAR